jgi:iron(II)-dependent oxidoreductase
VNTDAMLVELKQHFTLLRDTLRRVPEEDWRHQYHPDLSPLGWHLGHCIFTEIFWVREVLLNDNSRSEALKALYVPELSPKPGRAAALPDARTLSVWAQDVRQEHDDLLPKLLDSGPAHRLLQDAFLLSFLIQHYAQHYETTMYIHAQRTGAATAETLLPALSPHPLRTNAVTVPAARYEIGAGGGSRHYDNESPRFTTWLESFDIARQPVSNGEFLSFVEDGGYERPTLWSAAGWQWRQREGLDLPDHWRRDGSGNIYGIDADGRRMLAADDPVYGVSYYEACAFASWAGARLPHEYEWEAAKKDGVLGGHGRVWEWCQNPLHPYAGFEAFPYEGYSVPYFDGRHYVLRGGSVYTRPCIRRPTFRNYYEADKRHIHAGLRLVWSRAS